MTWLPISFKEYEPQTNQKFYTEKLVRIDGMSSPYLPPDAPVGDYLVTYQSKNIFIINPLTR